MHNRPDTREAYPLQKLSVQGVCHVVSRSVLTRRRKRAKKAKNQENAYQPTRVPHPLLDRAPLRGRDSQHTKNDWPPDLIGAPRTLHCIILLVLLQNGCRSDSFVCLVASQRSVDLLRIVRTPRTGGHAGVPAKPTRFAARNRKVCISQAATGHRLCAPQGHMSG